MYETKIEYDREIRDYGCYLRIVGHEEWELVGFARTHHEAEVTLTEIIAELMSGQYFREVA